MILHSEADFAILGAAYDAVATSVAEVPKGAASRSADGRRKGKIEETYVEQPATVHVMWLQPPFRSIGVEHPGRSRKYASDQFEYHVDYDTIG